MWSIKKTKGLRTLGECQFMVWAMVLCDFQFCACCMRFGCYARITKLIVRISCLCSNKKITPKVQMALCLQLFCDEWKINRMTDFQHQWLPHPAPPSPPAVSSKIKASRWTICTTSFLHGKLKIHLWFSTPKSLIFHLISLKWTGHTMPLPKSHVSRIANEGLTRHAHVSSKPPARLSSVFATHTYVGLLTFNTAIRCLACPLRGLPKSLRWTKMRTLARRNALAFFKR